MPRTLQPTVFHVSRQTRLFYLMISVLFCLTLVLTGGRRAGAAGGDLDPSFNPGGVGASSGVNAIAVQPNGKIIIAGAFSSYNGDSAASNNIARLNADGTLDATFNNGGAGTDGAVIAVAVQPDGKVLIGGFFNTYNGSTASGANITRLNPNGTRDTTFNYQGSGANNILYSIALQPDGKIIIAGEFTDYNGDAAASDYVTRLNTNGTLDTTFNPGGAGPNGAVRAVAVRPDGKIVIGGEFTSYNGNAALSDCVARLNADGTRDASFNPGGLGADNGVRALALQPDGRVVIGGHFTTYNGDPSASDRVARINANGTLDTTFNYGGAGADLTVYAVAAQVDGKVVIGGDFTSYNDDSAVADHIVRLGKDGTLDPTFNPGGAGTNGVVHAAAVQADGRVVIGGDFTSYNGDPAASDHVARLLPATGELAFSSASYSVAEMAANALITLMRTGGTDNKVVAKVTLADNTTSPADYHFKPGTLDAAFNPGGAGANGSVYAVALQPDGKIIIGGNFTNYNGNTAASDFVVRLNANGTPDTSFNPGGAGANSSVYAVAVQPDGKIIIGGLFTRYNGNTAASDHVARLNANGTLDTSFNPGGAGTNSYVYAVAVQPDGKILIAGTFDSYNGDDAASDNVARLNADGTLDTSFNPGGAGAYGSVTAVALQPDGKIIIGGGFTLYNANLGSNTAYGAASDGIARLNANGRLDTSFNPNKWGTDTSVSAVAVQPDGKILIGGFFNTYNGAAPSRVTRVSAGGTLDTTFNPGGAGPNSAVRAVVLQPDGKIIIAGHFTSYNGDAAASNGIARLNANGTLDTSFNPGGTGVEAFKDVQAVALQPDGKILIGGFFTDYNGDPAASDYIARLGGDLFVTWPAGDASNKTVLLPIVNDVVDEDDETLDLALSIVAGGATLGAPASSVLTIVDNEAQPKLSINNVTVTENNTNTRDAVFTVKLSGANSKPVTVNYQTVDATATAPADYTALPLTTLTFSPGETSKIINVLVKGDMVDELNETFKVVLSSPTNATIAVSQGIGTITDNDTATISIKDVSVTEPDSGTTAMTFTVKLSLASSRTVTVKYATANGTAAAPADYTAVAPTTLSFSPGQMNKTVTVSVKGELIVEPNETLFVNLSSPVNATIADNQGQGTILNDD